MRRWGVLAAVWLLASCAFSSEQALFSESDAAAPFDDGAVYGWKPNDEADEDIVVRFTRAGAGYEIRRIDRDASERPMQALFVDIPTTPEPDYIVQVVLDADMREGFVYAYLWWTGEGGYRAFVQPSAFDESGELRAVEGYCEPAQYNGCTFRRAEDVRRYYQEVLYPAIARGHIPARYLDLTPAALQGVQGKR